jgi:hypothetical protein
VREVYRSSAGVVSDRIHALILGMTEGAAPIGLASSDLSKVARTFALITDRDVASTIGHDDGNAAMGASRAVELIAARSDFAQDLTRARAALDSLSFRIRSVGAGHTDAQPLNQEAA